MASCQMCGPCSRVNKVASAVKFCTDCEDTLCSDCVTMHKAFKALALHHLIDEEVQTDKAFNIRRTCSDHPDMNLEFYCSSHENLCCRTCSVILPINIAARGIKTSVMLNNVTEDLKALLKTTDQLREDRVKNKEYIRTAKLTALQKIAQFKRELIQKLDELEKKIMTEVDVSANNLSKKAESDLSEIDTRHKDIVDIWEQLEFLTKHGSESQMLMMLNTIRVDITKQENDVQTSISTYESIDLIFKASGIQAVLNSLGSVEKTSVPCSITYKPPKHAQAQIPQENEKIPTKFSLYSEFKLPVPYGRVSSICVTFDNRLLLCHSENKRKALSIWSDTGDHIQDCALDGNAWGLAIIPGTNEAVVTLPATNLIQFVNLTTMTQGPVTKVPARCYGVTVIKDMIVLGGTGTLYFLSITGSLKKTLNVGSDNLHSLKTGRMNIIYCCESDKNTLHCIDIKGTVIFSYKFLPDFNGHIDMTSDGKDNLYVTTCRSNNLHRLSPDGRFFEILLKMEDGLNEPWAVAFNKNYTKLYIADGHGINKRLLIFDCA